METFDQRLRQRTRRSYETGRLRLALARALPLAALAAISLIGSHESALTLTIATLAVASFVALSWRGRELGRGAQVGLVAGAVPFFTSFVSRSLPHLEVLGACVHGCVMACAAASVLTTVGLSWFARNHGHSRSFWLASTWTAVSAGAIGCACVGVTGVALLVAAVVLAGVPVVALSRDFARA